MCSKRSKGKWFNSIVQAQHVKSCKKHILKLYEFISYIFPLPS